MPDTLYEFASDSKRYELRGEKTLHDSRISHLNIGYQKEKEFSCKVVLYLELADLGNKLQLEYSGVVAIQNSFVPDFWPNQPVDLLTHEFTLSDNGLFRHFIEFDRGVWCDIIFSSFAFAECD